MVSKFVKFRSRPATRIMQVPVVSDVRGCPSITRKVCGRYGRAGPPQRGGV